MTSIFTEVESGEERSTTEVMILEHFVVSKYSSIGVPNVHKIKDLLTLMSLPS